MPWPHMRLLTALSLRLACGSASVKLRQNRSSRHWSFSTSDWRSVAHRGRIDLRTGLSDSVADVLRDFSSLSVSCPSQYTMVKQAESTTDLLNRPSDAVVRRHMVLTGILQGIGCRPEVYRLAVKLGLAGWVVNTTSGVRIEIEGTAEQCRAFERDLREAIPFPGQIYTTSVREVPPLGETTFRIAASHEEERLITPIPPDMAVCRECVQELFDPANHRYLYPFITCTLCGPRFTVVRSFPYDRERTSMADFTMCQVCRREYEDPLDRRFHSQTNSCPECGPSLTLTDVHGDQLDGDPIVETARMLAEGRVVAVKGIGGFHLACDALSEEAVQILRERKGREEKPFAVMMPDLTAVKRYCKVSPLEEELLSSPVSPILLLSTRGDQVAANVAPFIGTLGVMLPYSPVHHLLFRHPGTPPEKLPKVLVMTSGNRAEEPIARGNREAIERLGDLADAFLLHNREIELRADDSIFRMIRGRPTVFRRSRGIVPGDFRIDAVYSSAQTDLGPSEQTGGGIGSSQPEDAPVVLAAGGDLKNVPAVIKGDRAVPGPHIGDLASPVAQDYFKQSVSVLTGYLETNPNVIAVDPHPEYFSNSLAREIQVKVVEVFHHHAHAVSLLFEHGLRGPALFAVFDGTGYGTDGTIWGGEFLVADLESFTREAHIGLYELPGGEAAIREPVRILAALLAVDGAIPEEFHTLMGPYINHVKVWLEAVRKGINAPVTSSAGRLFDAAAAAIGFTRRVTFEGEAAMWLEGVADPAETGEYEIHTSGDEPIVVEPSALIVQVARDMLQKSTRATVAARFHNSMARIVACVVSKLALKTGIDNVGLTGGCFQNKLLTEKAASLLEEQGFRVLLHETVPPNDGGIALGQAICARARL